MPNRRLTRRRVTTFAVWAFAVVMVGCDSPLANGPTPREVVSTTGVATQAPDAPDQVALVASPAPAPSVAPASTAIVPGAVNRTSLAISATYDVDVRLSVATRRLGDRPDHGPEPVRRRHRPPRAQHGHGPPGRPRPRHGHGRRKAHQATRRRPDDRRPARGHAPRRRLDDGRRPVHGAPPLHVERLELAVHPRQRDRRHAPLDPVDQPRPPVRPAQPRRPVRDAGQPAGHGPDS